MLAKFELSDEAGFRSFLKEHARVVVLLRGDGCPYSATFEPAFREISPPPGWAACIRMVEEGGRGPVAAALGVEVTPSVAAFEHGAEISRLHGKLLLGVTRQQYKRWIAALATD